MGIKDTIKNSASSTLDQIKSSMNLEGMGIKVSDIQSRLNIPELQVPDKLKDLKPNINTESLKVPDANAYIQPVKDKLANFTSGISMPAEVGGFKVPELPDMSSFTDKANSYLADTGIALKSGISFNDIKTAVTKSDFSSMIDFKGIDTQIDPTSIQHVSDGTISSLDSFDLSETQQQIDELTNQAGIEHIDISQYF